MYIKINDTTYRNVIRVRHKATQNVIFVGDGIPALGETPESIETYRDDGFLLCTDSPGEYKRVVLAAGSIQLLKEEPSAPVVVPDESIYPEEIAEAITEGVNSI